jgi:hypothetical protein
MAYVNINNPANFQLQGFDQMGFRIINNSFIPVEGEYYREVYAIADASVTTVNMHGDDFTNKEVLAGTSLYGLFSSVEVDATGEVIAYIA